ncbi:RIP metalloprotease RseP [Candidatus Margulisiibacteriota bacterium]
MFLTIFSFLFVFTIVALIHEAGHMYFSKKVGIRVHEFGLGFGPTLWQTKKSNTTYKINLLPILGYVKIAGIDTDDPQEKDTPENEKYYNKKVSQKFLSIFAGAFMNLVLGFVVFSLLIMVTGVPSGVSNEIATVSPGSVAAKISLMPGDRLISVDGKGLDDPEEAVKHIHQSADKEVRLIVERDGERLTLKATPKYHERMKIGLIGFSLKPIYERVNPIVAVYYGFQQTVSLILMIFMLLGRLFVGQISVGDLAGPVGIAHITGQYAQQGLVSLLYFLAFFSVNIAVVNLLPIPALDGGRLCFVLLEGIRRKPIDIEKENKIHQVGMFVLLGLLALLTINDILRFFR